MSGTRHMFQEFKKEVWGESWKNLEVSWKEAWIGREVGGNI